MRTSLKDWPKVYRRLGGLSGLDEHQRILFARSLAATPDERWEMNVNFLRLHGAWGAAGRKHFQKLRREFNDTSRPGLWKLRLTNEEMTAKVMMYNEDFYEGASHAKADKIMRGCK